MSQEQLLHSKKYLMTSQELLDPTVGAIEIGLLETGKFHELQQKMAVIAQENGIERPLMVVDLIYKANKLSELGSPGQPYPIIEAEWEIFVQDIPKFCDAVPKVYVIDGSKYTAPI